VDTDRERGALELLRDFLSPAKAQEYK
jgi:hypothetical protein